MNKNIIITAVIMLIIGAGIGYFGANTLHPATPAQNMRGNFAGAGGMMRGGNGAGGLLSGTVAAKDSGSVTINTRDGSSHVVIVTPDTTVSKSVSGSLSDVATGTDVIVSGTTNSDGSVSASVIQIRPATPAPTTN